jgi:Fe-S cluster biosynthesis and repair protein YggX
MTRTVHCQLMDKEAPGLEFQPYPGDLGVRIYNNICAEGWKAWLAHQTMLINEHRLSPINPEHKKFLITEMEKFFFEGGSAVPDGYVPPEE